MSTLITLSYADHDDQVVPVTRTTVYLINKAFNEAPLTFDVLAEIFNATPPSAVETIKMHLPNKEVVLNSDDDANTFAESLSELEGNLFNVLTIGRPAAHTLAPSVSSVSFSVASGNVVVGVDDTFKYTISVDGTGVGFLELDIDTANVSAPWQSRVQFWLSADVNDPYDGDKEEFEQYGITVEYDNNVWTIDFGDILTPAMIESGNITINTAVRDVNRDKLWNDMNHTIPEGRVVVNLSREEE